MDKNISQLDRSIVKLLEIGVKPSYSRYSTYKERVEGRKKKKINTRSNKDIRGYRLKVYSLDQIPNLESIAKIVINESATLDKSDDQHLILPSIKVYSPAQVFNLEKIAREDFGSDFGVKAVKKKEKPTV